MPLDTVDSCRIIDTIDQALMDLIGAIHAPGVYESNGVRGGY